MCQCACVCVCARAHAHAPSLSLSVISTYMLSHIQVRACRVFAGAYKACAELEAELVDSAVVLTLQVLKNKMGGAVGGFRVFSLRLGIPVWRAGGGGGGVWGEVLEEVVEACGEMLLRIYTPIHPHPRARARTPTPSRAHAHLRTPKCTRTRTRTHPHAYARMHARAHTRTQTQFECTPPASHAQYKE